MACQQRRRRWRARWEKTQRSRCRAYNLSGTWISAGAPSARLAKRRHKLQIAQKQKINKWSCLRAEQGVGRGREGRRRRVCVWDECHIWWPFTERRCKHGEVAWLHSRQIALQWKWEIFVFVFVSQVSGQSAKCGSTARRRKKKHKWLDDGGSASGRHWQWARQRCAKSRIEEETETETEASLLFSSLLENRASHF